MTRTTIEATRPTSATPLDFAAFRPADNTAPSIGAAITRAEAALVASGSRAAEAKEHRDALLLEGSPDTLAAAEGALAQARGDAERIEAILPGLRDRLTAARAIEADAEVNEARIRAEAAVAAWNTRRAELLGLILSGANDLKRLHGEFRAADADYAEAAVRERELRQGYTPGMTRPTLERFLHDGSEVVGERFMNTTRVLAFVERLARVHA